MPGESPSMGQEPQEISNHVTNGARLGLSRVYHLRKLKHDTLHFSNQRLILVLDDPLDRVPPGTHGKEGLVEYVNHGQFFRRFYGAPSDHRRACPVGTEEPR